MKRFTAVSLILILYLCIGAQEIPKPQGYINDFAGILDGGSKNEIAGMITGIEQSTGVEIAVVTLSDLGNVPIEQLGLKYYESWGIGKKGKDNGVLIMVAVNDRKAWITTGYGIEGTLPDGLVGEIYRNEMVPRFKQGDYAGGIKATIYKIGKAVGGETVSYPKTRKRNTGSGWGYLNFPGYHDYFDDWPWSPWRIRIGRPLVLDWVRGWAEVQADGADQVAAPVVSAVSEDLAAGQAVAAAQAEAGRR